MQFVIEFFKKPYLAIFSTFLISFLCFMPSRIIPQGDLKFIDKLYHFAAFAGLSFLWMAVTNNYLKVFAGLALFAFFIEIVQKNLPQSFHRSFDYYDALADIIGVLIGFIFFLIYQWLIRRLGLA